MGGGFTFAALTGSVGEKDKSSETNSGSSAKAFDPRWANSLTLLQHLQNEGMLQRDVAKAGLGQIVLTSGSLEIFDIPLLRSMFSNLDRVRAVLERAENKKITGAEWQKHKQMFGIIGALPLSVQLMMTCSEQKVWAVMDETCLQTSATNLFLKYGSTLFGTWHLLGILDALPDPSGPETTSTGDAETAMDLIRHLHSSHRGLGRPKSAYSVTPLPIFRDVTGVATQNVRVV